MKEETKLSDPKRLVKNVFFVYFRIFFTTIIGIVTTRFVFQALGQSNYGLYNVVAGIIAIMAIVSTAMTTTTRRFINVEMGKTNPELNKVFSTCFIINLAFALLLLLLAETFGLFYIHHYLKVAPDLHNTALIIFHISTITSILNIINIPYQSLIAAFERFSITATIDICISIVKLCGVLCLFFFSSDRLIIYACIMSGMTLISLNIYSLYCKRQWKSIVHLRFYKDKNLFKRITIFNNYTVLGASAYIGKAQGTNMMINYFFGTLVNGAFSIAYMIENYSMIAVSNLTTAAGPQIAKEYSAGNVNKALSISSRINRLSVILMLSIVFIALIELPFYLKLWLGTVPIGAIQLCQWTLISALVRSFSEGIPPLVQASGKIKWFQIVGSSTQLLTLIIGWIFFKNGYPPKSIIMSFAGTSLLNFIITLFLLRLIISKEQIFNFLKTSFLPIFTVGLFYAMFFLIDHNVFSLPTFLNILSTICYCVLVIIAFGLNKREREMIRLKIIHLKDKFK